MPGRALKTSERPPKAVNILCVIAILVVSFLFNQVDSRETLLTLARNLGSIGLQMEWKMYKFIKGYL